MATSYVKPSAAKAIGLIMQRRTNLIVGSLFYLIFSPFAKFIIFSDFRQIVISTGPQAVFTLFSLSFKMLVLNMEFELIVFFFSILIFDFFVTNVLNESGYGLFHKRLKDWLGPFYSLFVEPKIRKQLEFNSFAPKPNTPEGLIFTEWRKKFPEKSKRFKIALQKTVSIGGLYFILHLFLVIYPIYVTTVLLFFFLSGSILSLIPTLISVTILYGPCFLLKNIVSDIFAYKLEECRNIQNADATTFYEERGIKPPPITPEILDELKKRTTPAIKLEPKLIIISVLGGYGITSIPGVFLCLLFKTPIDSAVIAAMIGGGTLMTAFFLKYFLIKQKSKEVY
jgi:hypothetical protein